MPDSQLNRTLLELSQLLGRVEERSANNAAEIVAIKKQLEDRDAAEATQAGDTRRARFAFVGQLIATLVASAVVSATTYFALHVLHIKP
jgi:hypothetical protein